MDKPIRYESVQEPLDNEERELMDPDNWDWDNPVELVVAEHLMINLPVKVTPEEWVMIDQVARRGDRFPRIHQTCRAQRRTRTVDGEFGRRD